MTAAAAAAAAVCAGGQASSRISIQHGAHRADRAPFVLRPYQLIWPLCRHSAAPISCYISSAWTTRRSLIAPSRVGFSINIPTTCKCNWKFRQWISRQCCMVVTPGRGGGDGSDQVSRSKSLEHERLELGASVARESVPSTKQRPCLSLLVVSTRALGNRLSS